jgi:uncharacterized protein (DUF58 family)
VSENPQLNYIQPERLKNLGNLELIARLVVEGFVTGLHQSPFHGFSVEFSQHRAYMPGDSLRYIDWKVYGRSDRFYIKQFEEETNLRCYLLLDISRSMAYNSGAVSKANYAGMLAAALSYLFLKQRDAVGLVLFDDEIRQIIPPRSVSSYLTPIVTAIDRANFGSDTNLGAILHKVAERIHRRSLIILLSDLLDEPDNLLTGLKHFRYDKHEVIVFHILDRQETEFDFRGDIVFEDLESRAQIKTQPTFIRETYKSRFSEFLEYYRRNIINNGIDYQILDTSTPFDLALNHYLLKRSRLK